MGSFIAIFVVVTVVGIFLGIILANGRDAGSKAVGLICTCLVIAGIGYIIAGNNRSGDGFGDLLEWFKGLLAIWSALMVGAGYGATRGRQDEEKRKSGETDDHRP